jgi:glycosyltransferase involved in cell wall biosynthesis
MNARTKILVPIRHPVGGIRTYLKYTYGKLNKASYEFTLVGPPGEWLARIRKELPGFDVRIIHSRGHGGNRALFWAILSILARREHDLIHSQGYSAGMISIIANFLFGLPHLVTVHHVFGERQFSDRFWERFPTIKKRIIEWIICRADVIQSVSYDAQANLLKYFPLLKKNAEKLVVIRNGIEIENFCESIGREGKAFVKEEGKFYLGFIGRYMPEKGFKYLINAVEAIQKKGKCQDIRVVSIGGFGEFFREYKKDVCVKGISDYFEFIGFVSSVAPILKDIDLLVIPSLGEACPLVPMEGLVCGTPIVGFSCVGLREVLRDTPAVMVNVADAERLANAILEVKEDYANVKRSFEDFVPTARERFDVRAGSQMLDQLFAKLGKRETKVLDRR